MCFHEKLQKKKKNSTENKLKTLNIEEDNSDETFKKSDVKVYEQVKLCVQYEVHIQTMKLGKSQPWSVYERKNVHSAILRVIQLSGALIFES